MSIVETSTVKPIRIVLVDDHTVVREGTREMLNSHPALEVVGETASGEELTGLLQLRTPDILLLDINLPGQSGIQLLEELRPKFPALKIILFSAHSDVPYIRRGLALKADGYLSKTVSSEVLQACLLEAMQRDTGQRPILSPDVEKRLSDTEAQTRDLTPREEEILMQVAQGLTNQAIATNLHLSVKTVDTHVANLMKKLGMNKRSQLIAHAYEQGWR